MQTGSNLTTKDKITAQLPGHQLQDKNMNGVPDRLETRSNTTGLGATGLQGGANDRNGNGIPDNLERRGLATGMQGGMTDLNRNGIPDQFEQRGLAGQSFTQGGMTDLNRNGIPDQLEGQGFGFVGSVTAVQTSVVDVRQAPVVVERIEKPAVVHEVYKTEEIVQIQPIIERERDQVDVYEVIQPMREREVMATEVRQATLPAQTRAVVVEDNSAFLATRSAPSDFSTREVVATRSQVVENAPIIHETIVHKVIEEVQPVIYKEIDRSILIKETLPIYEKIVEAPHAHHTVLPMRDLGVRTVTTTTTTGYTDLNRDGIPDQLQGGMYQTTGMHSGITSQGFINQGLQGGLNDRNGNGIPDNLEQRGLVGQSFTQGGMTDLNRNGIPDSMERRGITNQGLGMQGGANDRNGNGIPDNLEGRHARSIHDLNGNGIPDRLEKGHGLNDLNGNGIPDSMERRGLTNQGIGMQGQQYGQPSGLLSQPTVIPSGMQSGAYGTGMQGLQGGLNDRNGNGIPDNLEKRRDLNGNGIPDQLEQRMGATTLNTNTRL